SIEYAAKHGIPIRVRKDSPYSVDENLWGRTIECGILEDPWVEPPEEVYALTSKATDAPREPRELVIGFEGAVPVTPDGATTPLRRSLDAFVGASQAPVTGEVRLRLEPGRCFVAGRRAEHGLYDYELATYAAEDAFRHEDAAGFVRLWGLGVETVARKQGTQD